MHLTALGNPGDNVVVLNVIGVVGLDVRGQTVQSALQGFLRRRVHHARLKHISTGSLFRPKKKTHILRCVIRAPRDKRNLVPRALATLEIVLDVEDGVSPTDALLAPLILGLGVEQLLAEDAVVRVLGRLFDNDLFPVVADLVDDPFGVLA